MFVLAVEYKLSWITFYDGPPRKTERIYSDEDAALQHFDGLKSIEAPHELRPCGEHVYDIEMKTRTVETSDWTVNAPNE